MCSITRVNILYVNCSTSASILIYGPVIVYGNGSHRKENVNFGLVKGWINEKQKTPQGLGKQNFIVISIASLHINRVLAGKPKLSPFLVHLQYFLYNIDNDQSKQKYKQ